MSNANVLLRMHALLLLWSVGAAAAALLTMNKFIRTVHPDTHDVTYSPCSMIYGQRSGSNFIWWPK